jgi:DNA-directed RNA polymerase specialized sigma24 family protein
MLKLKREGLTDAHIAEKFGIATQPVSNRIATARRKMRQKEVLDEARMCKRELDKSQGAAPR